MHTYGLVGYQRVMDHLRVPQQATQRWTPQSEAKHPLFVFQHECSLKLISQRGMLLLCEHGSEKREDALTCG